MGAKKKITPEIECFIKEHASEYSNRQFRQWLKEEYGIECTLKYIGYDHESIRKVIYKTTAEIF